MKNLFPIDKVGIRDYSDVKGISGKVEITREFLEEIANDNYVTRLTGGHPSDEDYKESIGRVKDLQVIGDTLFGEMITGESLKGKGASMALKMDLTRGKDGIYTAINPKLDCIGLTPNPRNGIIYNSKPPEVIEDDDNQKKDERNEDMGEEIGKLNEKVNNLQKELNESNADKIDLERKLAKKDVELNNLKDIQTDLSKKEEEIKGLQKQIDEMKPKSEEYDKIESENREKDIKQYWGKKEEDSLTEDELALFEGMDSKRVKMFIKSSVVNEDFSGGGQRGSQSDPNAPPQDSKMYTSVEDWKKNKKY